MSSCKNLSVEKLLLKLRQHLWRVTTGSSGNVVRNVAVHGREIRAQVRKSGAIELEIKLGSTSLYAYYNGRDKLVYNGTDRFGSMLSKSRSIEDAQVLYLLRDNVKRAFPDYNKSALSYKKPETKNGRHRMVGGAMEKY